MNTKLETPISFLKPEYLLQAEDEFASRKIARENLHHIQDTAISGLVKRQIDCGMEIITDGAYRQINGLRDFWMSIGGVEPTVILSGRIYQDQNAGEVIPKVNSEITFNPSHDIFNDFCFLHEKAGDGSTARIDIPAPSLFYLDLIRNEWYDKNIYSDTKVLARDISNAYNKTIKALYEAGCRRLLLIDRTWGRLCDRLGAKILVQGGIDLTNLPGRLLDVNNEALRDIPDDMHIILYAPYDATLRQECTEVVKCLCSHQRINAIMTDYPNDDECLIDLLNLIPKDKEFIIGVEDSKEPQTLTQDDIREIITKVGSIIPDKNISYTTKGGFVNNCDPINFSSLDEHDQWNKLQNLMSYKP